MVSFTKREQIVILLIAFIIILTLSFKFFLKDIIKERDNSLQIITEKMEEEDETEDVQEIEEISMIMVHISGQVYNPGLIELESDSRVKDAVKLAGGLKKDADIDAINLAKKLSDEEKIYIPKIGEEYSIEIPTGSLGNKESSGKININTCTKESLISLPGIGEVTANKIIEYRETNKFNVIEDIKKVSGIGDKKFEAIKEQITVK